MYIRTWLFEKGMRKVIKCILHNKPIPNNLLEHAAACDSNGYVLGLKVNRSITNAIIMDVSNPVVTYEGLKFYEFRHPNLKANVSIILSIFASVLSLSVAVLSNLDDILQNLQNYFL